jgi:serine/threonine-protein kinase
LARGALTPAHALDVTAQIASGLARAHQMGVIHRDLKPDNILLLPAEEDSDVERVKILDFGIAKILDQPSLTAMDKIFGTPGYIAPEYAAGAPIDGRSDLYSLGVVLYEMVTAQLPFDVEYPADLLIKHMLEPPIPPRERNPSVPEAVEQLILQALAKDPSQRYRDAFHMLEEIARVKSTLSPRDMIVDPPRRSDFPPMDETQEIPEPTPSLTPPRPEVGGGIAGARAWGRYLEALRNDVDSRARVSKRPPALETHLARMDAVCGLMQDRSDRVQQLRTRMIALEARGREFRTTIGRAIDSLAGELSVKARERDAISGERETLERSRDELMKRGHDGDRDAAGQADAVLWEIGAVDEALRIAVTACEDVEYQLQELGTQLERLSEALEADQNELVTDLDTTLRRLALDDQELRTLATTLPI